MPIPRSAWHWTALVALWAVVVTVVWLVAVQVLLVVLAPSGVWRWPGISRVTVVRVQQDPENRLTDKVYAKQGERPRVLCMLKEEAAELRPEDEIWVLENYVSTGVRPDQFRLTPLRLLTEYPEPLLLLALLGVWRVRRAQAKAHREPPPKASTVWKDDFHERAYRHDAPKDPKGP